MRGEVAAASRRCRVRVLVDPGALKANPDSSEPPPWIAIVRGAGIVVRPLAPGDPTDPDRPPPEPVQPIATPPNPGQVQPTPAPM